MVSFSQKIIQADISLGQGSFSGSGGNSVSLTNLRMQCHISCLGQDGQARLDDLAIYGLPLSQMNQLTNVGQQWGKQPQKNHITVSAGSATEGMFQIFDGDIWVCTVDGRNMPQVCLRVFANAGSLNAKKPIPVTTYPGQIPYSQLVGQICQQMGYQFENNNVTGSLTNPYLHGTGISQIRQCAKSGSFNWFIDKQTLAIWPQNGSRSGGGQVLISPQTGMVGYPSFQQNHIYVTSYFNPQVKVGGVIQVQSALTAANGLWTVNQLYYNLESFVPRGQWFMDIVATPKGGESAAGEE